MAPQVFVTGATGYIGGDWLFTAANAHPDWELSALVRSKDKAAVLSNQYPKIRVVHGDLDSHDILEEEVGKADIVFHFADCDHVPAAEAIARGAKQHTPERPLWLIHTSGTGLLAFEDIRAQTYGIERPKVYNDWEGIDELMSFPSDASHRDVDEVIIKTGKDMPTSVRTAIVCPPTIYGLGRGPVGKRSIQVPIMADAVLKRGKGFMVGGGENIWHQVHVHDLSNVYLLLGEAAAEGGGRATWNDKGYYLAENGPFAWGDICRALAQEAFDKGYIKTPEVESLESEQTTEILRMGRVAWGSNSRGTAIRARKLLAWEAKEPKLIELLPHIVELEAKELGL